MVELINEVLGIEYKKFNFEMLPIILESFNAMVEDDLNEAFESNNSYLVRECAENRNGLNDQVLKQLLKTKISINEL